MNESTFDGMATVHEYLESQGWKVSQSTLYNHKNNGKLRPGSDGLYSQAAVDKYAAANLRKADGSGKGDKLAEQKAAEDLRLIRARRRVAELKAQQLAGDLVPRAELDTALVSRAHIFRAGMTNLSHSAPPELIAVCGGDPKTAPEVTAKLMDMFEDLLDQYANDQEHATEVVQ